MCAIVRYESFQLRSFEGDEGGVQGSREGSDEVGERNSVRSGGKAYNGVVEYVVAVCKALQLCRVFAGSSVFEG